MGIKDWFTQLLPKLSSDSIRSSQTWPKVTYISDLVTVDLSGIVFHLPGSAEPFQWGLALLESLPAIHANTTIFLCSDNNEVKLPYKHVTRSMRPKSDAYPEAEHIVKFGPTYAELEDGSRVVPEMGEEWMPARLMGNRKSKRALFEYLVNAVRSAEFQSPGVIIEDCVNEQAAEAEADITIVNRIRMALNQRSKSQETKTDPLRVLIRTDDSDVTLLCIIRFQRELVDGIVEIFQSRGSKYGMIDINQAARDIFGKHRLTRHDLLALSMAAGNDYVDKQWCTPNVGHGHLVLRLLSSLDTISIPDVAEEWTLERVTRWFQALSVGARADTITPLNKPISLKEDSSSLTRDSVRTRLSAEQGIVPWEYMTWLRNYWCIDSDKVFKHETEDVAISGVASSSSAVAFVASGPIVDSTTDLCAAPVPLVDSAMSEGN